MEGRGGEVGQGKGMKGKGKGKGKGDCEKGGVGGREIEGRELDITRFFTWIDATPLWSVLLGNQMSCTRTIT